MTPEQVKLVRDFCWKDDGTGNHMAGRMAIVFNNEVCFVDTGDYIIWDDPNELVHCIRANSEDPVSQAQYPYRITSGMYANAQYIEGIYNMKNFKTAIKEMFTDKGLINAAQEEQIMTWANSIRNSSLDYKAKGPYFSDTTVIPASDYQPEIRQSDGIYRAAPTNFISKQEKIDSYMIPAIEGSSLSLVKRFKDNYDGDMDKVAVGTLYSGIKAIFEAFPKKDLQAAQFTNGRTFARFGDANFEKDINMMAKNIIHDNYANFRIIIDAYNARKVYNIEFKKDKDDQGDKPVNPSSPIKDIRNSINTFFDGYIPIDLTSLKRSGFVVSIDTGTNINRDIDRIIDHLSNIKGIKKLRWSSHGSSVVGNIGDVKNIENFKEEVKKIMPTENGNVTGNLEVNNGTSSVTYRFNVKYYNQAECPAKIGDVFYNTVSEACAVGGVVELVNDVTESVVIPADKIVNLKLNGHTLTAAASHAIENKGNLSLFGPGTVDCNTPKKTALLNTGTAKLSGNVELTRSADTAETTAANSGYVILNYMDMEIIEANVHVASHASSLVSNGWYDTKTAGENDKATMIIRAGTFTGGMSNIKNDELGELTVYGGTYSDAKINEEGFGGNQAIQNWHILTIEDGTFTTNISTGTYGKGIGHTVIKNGDFSTCQISKIMNYESDDINIYGGKFNKDLAEALTQYLVDGYTFDLTGDVALVVKMNVYQQVDNIIANLPETKGLTITEDPDNDKTYNVITSNGLITNTTMIDQIAAIDGLKKITIAVEGDESTAVEYDPETSDLDTFKTAIDALLPKSNTDPEVTLVMTVE